MIGFGVRRIWVRDRGRRIGAATAIAIGAKARLRSGTTNLSSRSGMTNRCCDCDCDQREGEVERIRSRTANRSSPLSSSSLSLSLSLSLCAGASPSPSALSLFSGKWEFEGKIKTAINLHPLTVQLKSIFEKCIFYAQPNIRKYGNTFHPKQTKPKMHRICYCHSWLALGSMDTCMH